MKQVILSLVTILSVAGMVAGATTAVFSDTHSILGNTVGTAKVVFDIRALNSGQISKPLNVTGLVPTQWTGWGRAELYNHSDSTAVRMYMHVDNVTGAACDKINLQVTTGHAGSDAGERARDVHNAALLNIQGAGNRVEVTGIPPFATIGPNWTQVIQQRAQLDTSADDTYQNKTCTWDEVFVAETPTY